MEDPDYVPSWEDEKGRDECDSSPRKKPRRSKTPEPEVSDFDWKRHYQEMKAKHVEPYPGIARPPLRMAAFNIQIFGAKKMKQKDITSILVKILQRYDLILIQEIRDRSDTALDGLVKLVSQVDPTDPYAAIVSERLGRTNSKEQYAFMFKTSRISVRDTYQFDDGEDNGKDLFQREPYAVRFYSPYTTVNDFGIIAIHTEPESAMKEMDALVKVYESTKKKWNLPDIMIAGDFNADEGYIHRDDWSKIALRNDRRFKWMIDDDTDTTVGNTDRAYDRFVVAGKKLTRAIVPGSSQVFQFDEVFGLTSDEAEDVSDHYPIEIQLKGTLNHTLQSQLSTEVSFTVKQKEPVTSDNLVRKIYKVPSGDEESAFFSHNVIYDDKSMLSVTASRSNVKNVTDALVQFQAAFPGVIYNGTVEMVKSYMSSDCMKNRPIVYGLALHDRRGYEITDNVSCNKNGAGFEVTIHARIKEPLECSVTVTRPMT